MSYQASVIHPASLVKICDCKNCMTKNRQHNMVLFLLIVILAIVLFLGYHFHTLHTKELIY